MPENQCNTKTPLGYNTGKSLHHRYPQGVKQTLTGEDSESGVLYMCNSYRFPKHFIIENGGSVTFTVEYTSVYCITMDIYDLHLPISHEY